MGARRPHTELYCHLVWATWDRLPMVRPEVEHRIHAALRAKAVEMGCLYVTIGGMPDHVHVLCRYPASVAVATLVQQLKGVSSHLATHELPGSEEFKWQGGYGAFSVDRTSLERVRDYVLNQAERHGAEKTWAALERVWEDD